MTNNPSELARLEEEREYHLGEVKNLMLSKATKAWHLEQLRTIERQLGVTSGDYNSSDFGIDKR